VPKRQYAKNKVLLAAAIELSRPALYRLFERVDHPGQVPGKGYNIEQWQRYANENIATWNRRDPHKRNGNGSTNPRDAAFIKRQLLAAEKEQFDLDVKREKYCLKSETSDRVMRNFGLLVREGDKAFMHELPPRLEGLAAGEIAKVLGRRWSDIREKVARSLESNGSNGH
jgi:hypothetical protein